MVGGELDQGFVCHNQDIGSLVCEGAEPKVSRLFLGVWVELVLLVYLTGRRPRSDLGMLWFSHRRSCAMLQERRTSVPPSWTHYLSNQILDKWKTMGEFLSLNVIQQPFQTEIKFLAIEVLCIIISKCR
ncbi:hypothetical protein ILYODFUR_010263 [Ilyodon furcidens]|uniref:Uncharacterized protein n=1 Tax=Ilyodon furcidens TaxID=33524 RepID=A0ABV0VEE2_9TELE